MITPAFYSAPEEVWDRQRTEERLEQFAEIASLGGLQPFDEQRLALRGIVAVDDAGRAASFEIALLACRQNLKTGVFKQAALTWLIRERDMLIVWSAHRVDAIKEAVNDFNVMLTNSDRLRRDIKGFTGQSGGEGASEIVSKRNTRIKFMVRSKGGGRALTGDKVILDEYWAAQAAHLGALTPTLAARSMRGDPQILMGSSAARPESDMLRAVVKRGRSGKDPNLFYVEFCAPPPEKACDRGDACDHALGSRGCGCDKPELIRLGNPAIGVLISPEHIARERRSMPPAEFGRERMGWHDVGEEDREVIPLLAWAAMLDPESTAISRPALACVFSSDRKRAAVGLAGWRSDGFIHVEVARAAPGTSWAADWLIDRAHPDGEHFLDPVAVCIDANGHERTLIPILEEAGIKVTPMHGNEVAAAYGMFFDAVTDSQSLRHRGQDDLTLALMGATTREIGDAGMAWGRRKSGIDIATLVTVTEALWGFLTNAPQMEEDDEPGVWAVDFEPEVPDDGLDPEMDGLPDWYRQASRRSG